MRLNPIHLRSNMSNDSQLAEGTYIICGAVTNASSTVMVMSPGTPQDLAVITAGTAFKWDVLQPLNYAKPNEFTIAIYDEDDAYAAPGHDGEVRIELEREAQVYDIVFVREDTYRINISNTNKALKWTENEKPVQVVTTDPQIPSDKSLEWRFYKASDPFVAYGRFFVQDIKSNPEKTRVFPHFGLLPLESTSTTRWSEFWKKIDDLNNAPQTKGKVFYKVFFLGRHGQAVNNIYQKGNSAGDLSFGPDAVLTQQGMLDAANAHTFWVKEQAEANIGFPQISYCSPFTRAMATNTITFGVEVYESDPPKLNTIVVEDCREQHSNDPLNAGQRRSKHYISHMFTKFSANGLVDQFLGHRCIDQYWPIKEPMKEVRVRARKVLKAVFADENENKKFVSITTHNGFMDAFRRVVGRGRYEIPNGCVLPMVIQYTKN